MQLRFLKYLFLVLLLTSSAATLSAQSAKGRFVVVLDPGHGGGDAGALGRNSKEKNIVLSVAKRVGEEIAALDSSIEVMYTRRTDVFIGLNERADFANKNKANLFVSIHANSLVGRKASAKGTETWVLGLASSEENLAVAMKENEVILKEDDYTSKYEGFDPKSTESYIIFEFMQNKYLEGSLDLASKINKGLVRCGLKNRGVKQAGFLVLRRTSMPSVLIELGFITNPDDERYMNSPQGQKEMGRSIATSIVEHARKVRGRSGAAPSTQATQSQTATSSSQGNTTEEAPQTEGTSTPTPEGARTYRVQVHTDTRLLKSSHRLFKGYKEHLQYYREGKLYKYTLYDTATRAEAERHRRALSKRFKGCFVVEFVDGKRTK